MKNREERELHEAFRHRLKRCVAVWRQAATALLLLQVARGVLLSLLLYFVADYLLALSEETRRWLNLLLPLGWLTAALSPLWRIWRCDAAAVAREVDHRGGHRRQEVLTARELTRTEGDDASVGTNDGMRDYLIGRSVARALERLEVFPLRRLLPRARLLRETRMLGVQLLATGLLLLYLGGTVVTTVASRLAWPGRDIPPYSKLVFEVTPEQPTILYGESVELSVGVSGAPVRDQVRLLTRRGSHKAQAAVCFQEGGGRYAQRLESVTQPLQFCFAVGRARSRWHSVDLQLQPQIVAAEVELVPPRYTGLPQRSFAAGADDIAGVRGTVVKLTLASNRPLRDGQAELLHGAGNRLGERVIEGRLADDRRAVFEWSLEADGEARVNLRDLRGTALAAPLVLPQRCLPDELPAITIHEPPAYALATTSAVLRLSGAVRDDFGLSRIDWVRGLAGYHDRGVTLRQGEIGREASVAIPLDLGRLGVAPGEVLEFYLEALDNNPHLAGLAASEIVRVQIISDSEYVEMQRTRETAADFLARYQAAESAIRRVETALEELQRLVAEAAAGDELQEKLEQTIEVHRQADHFFRRLAEEFAIYDIEKVLHEICEETREVLEANLKALEDMAAEPAGCSAESVAQMAARLQKNVEALTEAGAHAGEVAQLAQLIEAALYFQSLVQRQEELVRRLSLRYGQRVEAADLTHLSPYGALQSGIVRELGEFAEKAARAAVELPAQYEELRRDTLSFLQALEESEAGVHMQKAVAAAHNSAARETWREAAEALRRLQELLEQCCRDGEDGNSFGGLCQGNLPGCCTGGNTEATLREMLNALQRRYGTGSGSGTGVGAGGVGLGESGYSGTALALYGPQRSQAARARGAGGTGAGDGTGVGRAAAATQTAAVEKLTAPEGYLPAGKRLPLERLPERYREAIKRYHQGQLQALQIELPVEQGE